MKDFTPVPWLELHCHGGTQVVQMIQELYVARGCQVTTWQEFRGACSSPSQAAALHVLAHAPTVRTAAIALDQSQGAMAAAIARLRELWRAGDRSSARAVLERLTSLIDVGRHLASPWRVVLAGAPNVGKSSLGNALAGFARSVVAPTPGTTRDVITTGIALDGWPIELADTAGQRAAFEPIESEGIQRAQAAMAAADLAVWLVDGSAPPVWPATFLDRMLLVINKCDLPPAWDWQAKPEALRVSAKTGDGLPELSRVLAARLVPAPPAPGEAVPFTENQGTALNSLAVAMRQAESAVATALLDELNATLATPPGNVD